MVLQKSHLTLIDEFLPIEWRFQTIAQQIMNYYNTCNINKLMDTFIWLKNEDWILKSLNTFVQVSLVICEHFIYNFSSDSIKPLFKVICPMFYPLPDLCIGFSPYSQELCYKEFMDVNSKTADSMSRFTT